MKTEQEIKEELSRQREDHALLVGHYEFDKVPRSFRSIVDALKSAHPHISDAIDAALEIGRMEGRVETCEAIISGDVLEDTPTKIRLLGGTSDKQFPEDRINPEA